ncbi:recombinase family protein [Mucilaginibacter sp. CAU 1740]|uniref:recombinase family protein n=1 Tax=Mucilaginibacter sp. CAU 1740 TaxID=3140365 RepID=UPI00325A49AC
MMKVADLYIRVSTDEQADKGYSQRSQEEMLRRYCQLHGISVGHVIYEDHSAKSFNRPGWQGMLNHFKKKSAERPHLILFTKWDRFSRNAADAYQMINLLRSYRIEPQAIEQPLDLTIPENKIMLAFYLAAPEVENDRRALNVFHGMRRAKKEGRWMATAPIGYKNKSHEDGRKYIGIDEPIAEILKWGFGEIATGKTSIDQVWKQARNKGLSCTRSNFAYLLRNPVYCGKIVIAEFKDEPLQIVQAQHQPIITEALFEDVQRVLDGRKRFKSLISLPSKLPLRGLLRCPKCDRMLTGSQSKGCRSYYSYYHCSSTCGIRFNADQLNQSFINELTKFRVKGKVLSLFRKVIEDTSQNKNIFNLNKKAQLTKQIEDRQARFRRAQDLLLLGDLDAEDYHEIKKETKVKIRELNEMRSLLSNPDEDIRQLANNREKLILDLSAVYQKANIAQKRKLIGALFPKNLAYSVVGFGDFEIESSIQLLYSFEVKLTDI